MKLSKWNQSLSLKESPYKQEFAIQIKEAYFTNLYNYLFCIINCILNVLNQMYRSQLEM